MGDAVSRRIQFSWNFSTGIAERVGPALWRVTGHVLGVPIKPFDFIGDDAERKATYAAFRVPNSYEEPGEVKTGKTSRGLSPVFFERRNA